MKRPRLLIAGLLLVLVLGLALWLHDLGPRWIVQVFTILHEGVARAPLLAAALFFLAYVLFAALALPAASLMTLAAGAFFGLWAGTLLVSFASSIGASLAFLAARTLLRDVAERRFPALFKRIEAGLARDGVFYLVSLRLVPIVPFFAINLAVGLTRLPLGRFYLASQIGMLPATLIYVNAGASLGALAHDGGPVLSPRIVIGFLLLALLPLAAPRLRDTLAARRLTRSFRRPRRFDCDITVIGAGSAGLVAAYMGQALRAKVTLIEAAAMGGDCLNTGCVPSKALIHAARQGADFAAARAAVQAAVAGVAPHDSAERYRALGVDVRQGAARIESPWSVRVGDDVLTTRAIVIAAGAAPVVPELPGLADCAVATSETLWDLAELPARLVILGGGPIGCEMAQAFARLGSAVTLVQSGPRLLMREDDAVSDALLQGMEARGVRVMLGTRAVSAQPGRLHVEGPGGAEVLPFERLLLALGRKPRVQGYGLEEMGIPLTPRGAIETNAWLQTLYPTIFACGDVAGPYQFTHMAGYQGSLAAINALLSPFWRLRPRYHAVPAVTFTEPEIARVGLNEREARARGIAYDITRYDLAELDRAIAQGERTGFVTVLTKRGSDRILGATILGREAGEMLTGITIAIQHGLGLRKLLGVIYPYPTRGEAIRAVAGQWRQARASPRALRLLERLHRWRRGG